MKDKQKIKNKELGTTSAVVGIIAGKASALPLGYQSGKIIAEGERDKIFKKRLLLSFIGICPAVLVLLGNNTI